MTQRIVPYASRWPLWLRRGPCEAVAMALIGLGVLMLMQPLSLNLYSYSFVTILLRRHLLRGITFGAVRK